MSILYRNTKIDDLNKIVTFPQDDQESFYLFSVTERLTLDILLSFYEKRFGSTSFWLNGEVIGYANFYRYRDDPKDIIYLGNVIVSPEHRGKGYSKEIVKTMIEKAKNEFNATELRLAVFCHNKVAYSLYETMDFKTLWQERRINFEKEEEPICIMGRTL